MTLDITSDSRYITDSETLVIVLGRIDNVSAVHAECLKSRTKINVKNLTLSRLGDMNHFVLHWQMCIIIIIIIQN